MSERTARSGSLEGGRSAVRRPTEKRTTTRPLGGHLVATRNEGDTRLFVHLLLNFVHRADAARREVYFGDLELATIGETVGAAAIDPAMRDANFRDEHHDYTSVVGIAAQRGINALSISESTGIPRETVRRKLKFLAEKGILIEKTRGHYVFKPGFVQDPKNIDRADKMVREIVGFMNECINLGLVRWAKD